MKTKIIYAFLFFSSIASSVWAYFTDPENRWIIYIIIACLVILGLGYGIYLWIKHVNSKKHPLTEKEILLNQDKEIIRKLFKLAVKTIGDSYSLYKKPLYIMMGTEYDDEKHILMQNGFESILDEDLSISVDEQSTINESDSYFKFWQNESFFVIELGYRIYNENGFETELWHELIKCLSKYRSQQACNGVVYALGCSFVQTGDKDYHDGVMNNARQGLLELNAKIGFNVPVHFALTNADCIKDFVKFFKIFEQQNPEKPLGFTIKNKERQHFDFANYEQKSREMVEYFSHNIKLFLKNLSEEETRSALSMPYELALFFNLFESNLKIITKEDRLKKCVWIRGIYFLIPNQQISKFDLLSQLVAEKADFDTEAKSEDSSYDKKRYFVANFFEEVILPSVKITGVNSAKKFNSFVFSFIKLSLLVIAILFVVRWYYGNWQRYINTRDDVVETITNFKDNMVDIKLSNVTFFEDIIISLNDLREMSLKLNKEESIFKLASIEQLTMNREFRSFYNQQLRTILLPTLESLMRENLYTLENTEDSKLYKGASAYLMLFDKNILDEEFLYEYLYTSIIPTIGTDINLKKVLKLLCHDLFATDYQKEDLQKDMLLVDNFDRKMDSLSVDDMLYTLVKLDVRNQQTINLLNFFGKNFDDLLYFDDGYDGYNIPFMFTREGFLNINISPRSENFKRLLKNLKLIKPNIDLSDESLIEISRKVQRHYFVEYIDYWNDILNHIKVKNPKNFYEVLDIFDGFSVDRESTIAKFFEYFVENTYLTKGYDIKAMNEKSKDSKKDQKDGDKKEDKKYKVDLYDRLDGSQIAAEFQPYYDFLGVNDDLEFGTDDKSSLNKLLKRLSNVSATLKSIAKTGNNINKSIFDYVTTHAASSDFDFSEGILDCIDDDTPYLIVDVLQTLHFALTQSMLEGSSNYIKDAWNKIIYSFYKKEFEGKFPFDLNSQNDVNISKLDKFLAPNGVFDDFYNKYLKIFVNMDGGYYSLVDRNGTSLNIPYSSLELFQILKETQNVLYKDNPTSASLKLTLTPRKMSGKTKLFELNDGSSLCTYNQGPRQPCTYNWPGNSLNPTNLSFETNGYNYGKSYSSSWGLLRVMADPEHSDLSLINKNGAQTWTFIVDDYKMVYDIVITNSPGDMIPIDLFPKMQIKVW